MRRLLLLVWIALLLVGGIGSDLAERCAAFAPRSCCCKATTSASAHGATLRRACGCGCKVDAKAPAPAPARVATRPAPEREPVARLADSGFASIRLPASHGFEPASTRERQRDPSLRLDVFCVWRI